MTKGYTYPIKKDRGAAFGTLNATLKTYTVTISKGTGVGTVTYDVWNAAGTKITTGGTSSSVTVQHGGKIQITGVTATVGYTVNSYTSTQQTITSNTTLSFTATKNSYTVYVYARYSGTTYTDGTVGQFEATLGSSLISSGPTTYDGPSSYWGFYNVLHGDTVVISNVSAKPGFKVKSGAGARTVTVTSGNPIYVDFEATTSSVTFSLSQFASTSTNTITKNAFTVTASLVGNLNEVASGTVLATVPANYRPKTAATVTNGAQWCTAKAYSNAQPSYVTPTITISTSGNVTANYKSFGTITHTNGGKWGSYSSTSETSLSITNVTWSVR